MVVELEGSEQEALDLVALVTNVVLEEHYLIVGVVVVVDPGVIPINSRGEKQRMHLRDGFLADQLDPIYVAYNMWGPVAGNTQEKKYKNGGFLQVQTVADLMLILASANNVFKGILHFFYWVSDVWGGNNEFLTQNTRKQRDGLSCDSTVCH